MKRLLRIQFGCVDAGDGVRLAAYMLVCGMQRAMAHNQAITISNSLFIYLSASINVCSVSCDERCVWRRHSISSPFIFRVSFSSRRRCHVFDKTHSMYYVNDGVFGWWWLQPLSLIFGRKKKWEKCRCQKTEENEIHRQHPTRYR